MESKNKDKKIFVEVHTEEAKEISVPIVIHTEEQKEMIVPIETHTEEAKQPVKRTKKIRAFVIVRDKDEYVTNPRLKPLDLKD